MKHGIGIYTGKIMDIGKILSGRPSSCPSLAKGSTLSLTMIMVADRSPFSCTGEPGTGNLIHRWLGKRFLTRADTD